MALKGKVISSVKIGGFCSHKGRVLCDQVLVVGKGKDLSSWWWFWDERGLLSARAALKHHRQSGLNNSLHSHSCGGWEVQDQGAGWFCSWWSVTSWLARGHLLAMSLHGRERELSSVAQSCPALCNPVDCSTPGLPVHHQLPELAQTHVHRVGDAIQPSQPLSCLQSFLASRSFPVSQFFTSGGQSIGVSVSASVLPMNIQDWFPLGLTGLISLQSEGLSKVFSSTTVQQYSVSYNNL